MRRNKIASLLLYCSLIGGTVSCGNHSPQGDADDNTHRTNLRETGELAAVESKSFILQRYGRSWWEMRIIGILEHGTIVHPGDSIIQLDPTDVKKVIINQESELETQRAVLEKLRVNQDNQLNQLTSNIKNATLAFELKKNEQTASRFEPPKILKIKELEFEQEKIRLHKEQKKLALSNIISANELKIQQIRVRQLEDEIKNAYDILPKLTVRTPIAGVFQVAKGNRSGSNSFLKVGDMLYVGNLMANVPDLTWMKVNTCISETDFLKIHEGQKVAVRLDALPKVVFDGKIAYIGKLCHLKDEKSKQKVFDVEVQLLHSDTRLKPGMTVSCEYLQ
ncbi:MAG: efflux RND transporter periplasmic adaptor subunit [Candidatus Symbiothrix sp.]|nr:efflux RND transporter periplasmic adaptor subunit [Candidatus Symbiothrix sp.]